MGKRTAGLAALLSVLLCVCGLLCAGCGLQEPQAAKTEITLLHGWSSNSVDCVAMREIFEEFNAENPDLQLNCIAMPDGNAVIEKAEEMYAVGKVPDIISTSGSGNQAFYDYIITNGYALDLMPYIEADPEFSGDVSSLSVNGWSTEDGRLFTVSDVLMMSGYWYNEELFHRAGIENVPVTWEEFEEACRRLNRLEQDGSVKALITNRDSMADLFDAFLAGRSPEAPEQLMEYARTGFDFESSLVVDGLEDFRTLCADCGIQLSGIYFVDGLDAFNSGKSAMLLGGVWSNVNLDSTIRARFATFPGTDGQTVSCVSAGINYILGSSGDLAREEACVRFLKYMLRDDIQEKLAVATGQMPSNPGISLEDYRDSIPLLTDAVQIANSAQIHIERSAIQWRNDENAYEYFNATLPGFLDGKISAGEFAAGLAGCE